MSRDIVSIDRDAACAVTDSGDVCEVVNWIDAYGDETQDADEAAMAVVKLSDDDCAVVLLDGYELASVH